MTKPKHDPTPDQEFVDEAIRENIRLGYMIEVSPGRFSLTDAGRAYTRQMLKGLSQ